MKITNHTERKLVLVAGLASVDAGRVIETDRVDIKNPTIAKWIDLGMISVSGAGSKPKTTTKTTTKTNTKAKAEEAGK